MRFCPFCSAENADELAVCQACGRRLPPLPPRRARNAPPTGVQLPPRQPPAQPPPTPQRMGGVTAARSPAQPSPNPYAQPPMQQPREPAPLPPPPVNDDRRQLMNAISPGPAAQRREPPAPESDQTQGRRRNDVAVSQPMAQRSKPESLPPPVPAAQQTQPMTPQRSKPPSLPPPGPYAPPAPITPPPPVPTRVAKEPVYPKANFEDDFNTMPSATAYDDQKTNLVQAPKLPPAIIAPTRSQTPTGVEPPPTRIQRPEQLADRPFTPPKVNPIPEIPEPTLINAAKYAVRFGRARWQRRGAIKTLGAEIKQDTEALDQVLGALGRVARNARVEGRVFSAENSAINAAEERMSALGKDSTDVDTRKVDENTKFIDIERERITKLAEAQRSVDEAQKDLAHLEGQRRGLRESRKTLERRQKAYLKNAEDADRQSSAEQLGDARQELRRSAEQHRKEAAALEPERQDTDRRLASLERPISEATARLDAAKAELDAAKRSLADAREGHTHRLDELDAEQKRKSREIAQAESEVARRLVTLGTLVNLNRIEDSQFDELYQRIDRLRGAITARTTEIERLTAEREAYDRGTLVRGIATIGGAFMLFIALLVILRAIV